METLLKLPGSNPALRKHNRILEAVDQSVMNKVPAHKNSPNWLNPHNEENKNCCYYYSFPCITDEQQLP
jgi:hypothetical protein